MPNDFIVRLRVLDPQHKPLGGKVDIEVKLAAGGASVTKKELDASKDIDVPLPEGTRGRVQVTVSAPDVRQLATQTVTLEGTGTQVVEFVIDKQSGTGPVQPGAAQNKVHGLLTFDNGLPATAVKVRVYNIGFGGKETQLVEVDSAADSTYSATYAWNGEVGPNLQVRVLDATNKEVPISATKFGASDDETMDLIVPSAVKPLATEFDRITSDLGKLLPGGSGDLAKAEEGQSRQDITLLSQATDWDARLTAVAAAAAKQAGATGLGGAVTYALLRVGLPSDPQQLAMVPSDVVQDALAKAGAAGIVNLSKQDVEAATKQFQDFAAKTRLSMTAYGAASSFSDLAAQVIKEDPNTNYTGAFADLYFKDPSSPDLWAKAAAAKIPAKTIDSLRLQGKFAYLTFNNAPLGELLQKKIDSLDKTSQLVDQDFHLSDTWRQTLNQVAGNGGDPKKLVPPVFAKADDPVAAYAGDMARKIRFSFPNHVAARTLERNWQTFKLPQKSATGAADFLRKAASRGYQIGRTSLNAFLKSNQDLAPGDAETREMVKTVHRLYQATPSHESLEAALQLGFRSANDIAKHSKADFLSKYGDKFPPGEAGLVHTQSQHITKVTFNFLTMMKQMDSKAPVYALSASAADLEAAKNDIVKQFPTMSELFGNVDYCQCVECRSVLSPAAYFVDLLDFLNNAPANPAKQVTFTDGSAVTPLDVLIGNRDKQVKDANDALTKIGGRRPDLAALPLTCENTNTTLPYIDLVNEILEYYIANGKLDANAAYDSGSISSADLIAEPQHLISKVYDENLKTKTYPRQLPFDLWIETVRAFLSYSKQSLADVLETLRPVADLELFSDNQNRAYYRAQIFAERLGLSPAEYGVLTIMDPATHKPSKTDWFRLYGYSDENIALNGKKDATDNTKYEILPLFSAKNLAERLGLSYQELRDVVATGFINPNLYKLIFQFERFGIHFDDACRYTTQPGFNAFDGNNADDAKRKSDLEAALEEITAKYKKQNANSQFDGRTWLIATMGNSSSSMLVLADPDSGCNFSATTLQRADKTAATALDFLKLNLFVRLWKKLGWPLDEVDRSMQVFFPTANAPKWNDADCADKFSAAWKTALVYLTHLNELNTKLAPALGRAALLPLWGVLPVNGDGSLYQTLFLAPAILNSDTAFDDPRGLFPAPPEDLGVAPHVEPFSAHQATVQGALGLSADDITVIFGDTKSADLGVVNGQNVPTFTLNNLSICYRYALLAKSLQMTMRDMVALKTMSGLDSFQPVGAQPLSVIGDDILFNQTLRFVKWADTVQKSGFTVEDLRYLLRHDFDPVGKYQTDSNALLSLMQTLATGLQQIQSKNSVPADLSSIAESLLDQTLSTIFPAATLKRLFAVLTNSQVYTASLAGVDPAIDPAPFAAEGNAAFQYDKNDPTKTQTVLYRGLLLDWKKAALENINNTGPFSNLLDAIQSNAFALFATTIGDLLGLWASLSQYESAKSGVAAAIPADALMKADPALSLAYDQSGKVQWLGYRGVLTDARKTTLTNINNSADFTQLLNDVQGQSLSSYSRMAGTLLAMLCNVQTYKATKQNVAANDGINAAKFADILGTAQSKGNIPAVIPDIALAYDAGSQTQTVTCTGVLTDNLRAKLAALPGVASIADVFQTIRTQATQLWQKLANNLLTVNAGDLDTYVSPLMGLDVTKQQRTAKAELMRAYVPLSAGRLSRQYVLQTLSGAIGADPSIAEALLGNGALLSEPGNAGKSLQGPFVSLSIAGLTASFYATTDCSGPVQGGSTSQVSTADATKLPANARSAKFEGYIQVPTDGPYRFYAELGNVGASAQLRIDAPASIPQFANPVIPVTSKATKDNDEISQFAQLKGGILYGITIEFHDLGGNGASLALQGENIPKGPLSQATLYASGSVERATRAFTLLSKVWQVLKTGNLTLRELFYITANSATFNNLRLSSLPTRQSDDSVQTAVSLFSGFLALAEYAELRSSAAGGTDGLIDVFAAAAQSNPAEPNTPWTLLANLTRRQSFAVQDAATALGAAASYRTYKEVRRIWETLKLLQLIRIPAASLAAATAIVSPAGTTGSMIAASFANAIKSQYAADAWRPIAQSVYDKLRRKKRDALVAYLVDALQLENTNQLFEYFLIDPGMEPVVQTSRLRLALSSVQTFVQRCLLNLETGKDDAALNVTPLAIDADWWAWMKRYRVWQANREIFLFPENWMEPELRLDKSDLFQTLEGALLQGDVNSDLVEDAFLTYLRGLEVRARLDIVAMYLDQSLQDVGHSTLHVLGRTYGHPHKYFYRTYSGSWSPWQSVGLDIDGDHIVMIMWKQRLNVFWLTFIPQAQPPDTSNPNNGNSASSLSVGNLASSIASAAPARTKSQVQLHWSEYFQGKWSTRISSDVNVYESIDVPTPFDAAAAKQFHIHVSKEMDDQGNEGAVRIHLDAPTVDPSGAEIEGAEGWAFRVSSKNCTPDFQAAYYLAPPEMVYRTSSSSELASDATFYRGKGDLKANFVASFAADGTETPAPETILGKVNNFDLLTTPSDVSPSAFLNSNEPEIKQAGSLIAPFFYKDANNPGATEKSVEDELTFLVQPSLTEVTVDTWAGWAVPPPQGSVDWRKVVAGSKVIPQVPVTRHKVNPGDPAYSVIPMKDSADWLTHPSTVVPFGKSMIDSRGSINFAGNGSAGAANRLGGRFRIASAGGRG